MSFAPAAGYTGFSVGLVNNRVVYIPIPRLVATSPRIMDPSGRTWERVRNVTRQPPTTPSTSALLHAARAKVTSFPAVSPTCLTPPLTRCPWPAAGRGRRWRDARQAHLTVQDADGVPTVLSSLPIQ